MEYSRRRRYYDCERFPEVAQIREYTEVIRAEAVATHTALGEKLAMMGPSYVVPLVAIPEDTDASVDAFWAEARSLSPRTCELITKIPYVISFAYSKLVREKPITPHEHWDPHLVAILCLQGGDGSYIIVGGERRDFVDGEMIVFDYTLMHESHTVNPEPRYALLMVIDPRKARR